MTSALDWQPGDRLTLTAPAGVAMFPARDALAAYSFAVVD